MHISDVHSYEVDETTEALAKECITEARRKAIKEAVEAIIDDEYDRLDDYAEEHLRNVAASRAEHFLERVLEGDEDAVRQLLGDNHSDRYRTSGYDSGKPWAELIHGRVFETGGIRLRRKIVEAHPELLRNERIADLESIIDGLTQQIGKLERQVDELCRCTHS